MINKAAIYEPDLMQSVDIIELERAGFVWAGVEALYHRDHWTAWNSVDGSPVPNGIDPDFPGDHWMFEWAFKAKTKDAADWLYD